MNRSKMVSKLNELANEIITEYTWEKFNEIFKLASDWNSKHIEKEEIFVAEIYAEDGYQNDGIMIEDDIYYYE